MQLAHPLIIAIWWARLTINVCAFDRVNALDTKFFVTTLGMIFPNHSSIDERLGGGGSSAMVTLSTVTSVAREVSHQPRQLGARQCDPKSGVGDCRLHLRQCGRTRTCSLAHMFLAKSQADSLPMQCPDNAHHMQCMVFMPLLYWPKGLVLGAHRQLHAPGPPSSQLHTGWC